MRKLTFFTGTRAEYYLLKRLIEYTHFDPFFEVNIIVSGTHLSPQHGYTINAIKEDGFHIAAAVDIEIDVFTDLSAPLSVCKSMGLAMEKLSIVLHDIAPDILILLGDRYESFCCASVAASLDIPIAHLHGGEQTIAIIDEAFRHGITKMSHLHFASCEEHRRRIIQLGEQPHLVWNMGAPGVENALILELLSEKDIRTFLNIPLNQPYFLCTFHPVTLELGQEAYQWQMLQQALDFFSDHAVIVTGANADTGGNVINELLAQWAKENPHRVHLFASLGVLRYLSAAKYADCVLGNSSSGIIEIPSLGTPVVNIGNRQEGRICSKSVLHCQVDSLSIEKTIKQTLTPQHKLLAKSTPNPYGGKDVAKNMADILRTVSLDAITDKKFYDLSSKKKL